MADREATADPALVITARTSRDGVSSVEYERVATGERFAIRGECNRCGLCVIGAARSRDYQWTGAPGTPGAVSDTRSADGKVWPRTPITPTFFQNMREMAIATRTATVTGCSMELAE